MANGAHIDGAHRDALGRALAWLAHPASLTGLALLLLNDHLLKAWYPGPVTGKLSDVAGMLMFPPLLACLAALAPRLPSRFLGPAALALTAIGFALVKASPQGAWLASHAWSALRGPSVVRADATDLLVLPALALSWWAWRRSADGTRLGRRALRAVRALVLVPVALLATVATSAPEWPETNWVGADSSGAVLVETIDGYSEEHRDLVRSTDRGLTFEKLPYDAWQPQAAQIEDCAAQECYRVVPGELHVQYSPDGGRTWTTAWQIRGSQLAALEESYGDRGILGLGVAGTPAGSLASKGLRVFPGARGHVVIVANGRDGILRRDVDGSWTRLGSWAYDRITPPPALIEVWEPTTGGRVALALLTAGAIALLALLAAAVAARASGPGGPGRRVLLFGAPVLGGAALFVDTLYASTPGPEGLGDTAGPVLLAGNLAVLAVAGWALAVCVRRGLLPGGRLALIVLAVLVGVGLTAWWHDGVAVESLDSGFSRALSVVVHIVAALVVAGVAVAAVRLRRGRAEQP
ncbi:hypothetical protein QEZ54_13665 [Catellatospora sp. KI3]|uniref:hypothetical protein n=1 Tax=Catellatospora sp. KI3 TaxID=3041620 RepID=UPI0024831BAD|nr:hypothetical protein [Catellatospora sp. KI3]MDI1462017.1 hypothetical protein [Catellatospora sp. KI3]